ncbi:hypothetical protein KF840_10135 [bacterium]|nr:hypothetical protein [bacterium]
MGIGGRQAAARGALAVALLALASGCGDGGGGGAPQGRIAVLSAFPGELAAVLARMTIEDHVTIAERNVRVGTLGGTPVVAAMTGIGLVNAATTTAAVLAAFDIRGVVVSGVAGSPLNVADVVAVTTWALPDGSRYPVDPRYQRLARRLAARDAVAFARCTLVPKHSPDPVCLASPPVLVVGGAGMSDDPFGGAFRCSRNAGSLADVYGCDAADPAAAAAAAPRGGAGDALEILIQDMESAAVARVAAEHGLPFIAFRGVSDGAGDPLDLPGFPEQFYAYYPLAAHNAAAAAAAFVADL